MIKLIRTLAPENGMAFEDVLSFETENYVGLWDHVNDTFVIFARSEDCFSPVDLGVFDDLDSLDEAVYRECDEHIIGVSKNGKYRIVLE